VRLVVDTNVFLRYLIKPSAAVRELIEDLWLGGRARLVTAPELLDEMEDVLSRRKILAVIQPAEGQLLVDAIRQHSEILPPLGAIPAFTRDAKDDKFIACALTGAVKFVVTEDADLLVLEQVAGVCMTTPYHLVRLLKGEAI
jgi:putative PIN family toxin of toxin-antitoxin system